MMGLWDSPQPLPTPTPPPLASTPGERKQRLSTDEDPGTTGVFQQLRQAADTTQPISLYSFLRLQQNKHTLDTC